MPPKRAMSHLPKAELNTYHAGLPTFPGLSNTRGTVHLHRLPFRLGSQREGNLHLRAKGA